MDPQLLFPNEIWEVIFGFTDVNTVLSLSITCSLFRSIINSIILSKLPDIDNFILNRCFVGHNYWYVLVTKIASEKGFEHNEGYFSFPIGYALKFVRNPTSEICIAAVKNCGLAMEYFKEPTSDICLASIQQNMNILEYIKKPTSDICLAYVQQNSVTLEYVKNHHQQNV